MLETNLWVLIEYHTAGCSSKICWNMPPLIKSIWIFLQKSCSGLKNLTTAITTLTHHTVSLKILSLLISISQTLCKHSLWLLRGFFFLFFLCYMFPVDYITCQGLLYSFGAVYCVNNVRTHRNLCIPKHGTDLINYVTS